MPRFSLTLFGFAASVLGVLTSAHAQVAPTDGPARFDPFWNVEITGSSMLSQESRQALPIVQYTRRDIERSGAHSLSDFIQSLPQQVNGLNDAGVAAGLAKSGPLSTALRGLAASTLVLLNGKRLPRYSRATVGTERTGIDLDIVPIEAVARIDLLTDGASTRYGSDAVAGVINIITTEAFSGNAISAQVTAPLAGGGGKQRAALRLGAGELARTGWDWQAHLGLERRQALQAQDRDRTNGLPRAAGDAADQYLDMRALHNLYAWPAVVLAADGQQVSPLPSNGQCPSGWFALTVKGQAVCRINLTTGVDVYPEQRSAQLYALGRLRLSEHLSAFAELAWSQRESIGASISPAWGPWSWQQDLDNGQTAYVAPFPLGIGHYRFTHDNYRLALGLQGTSGAWRHQTTLTLGESLDEGQSEGLLNRLDTATHWAALGLDANTLTSGSVDAATLAALQAQLPEGYFTIDRGRSRIDMLEAVASRKLGETDAGDIALGLGASWGRERLWTQVNALGTGVANQALGAPIDGQRQSASAHAELEYPLLANTTLGAQVRHDHYSDVGEVTTGKLALRHQHSRQLMWRASYGTGFRAPTIEQTHGTELTPFAVDQNDYFDAVANPDLRPEQSRHFSAGLRLEPSPNWSLGLDYWHLNIRDGIQLLSRADILANANYSAQYLQVHADGTRNFTLTPLNLARRTQSGIDYDLQWRYPTSFGRWRAKWQGSFYTRAMRNSLDGSADLSELGELYDGFHYVPRHRATAQLALERPQQQFWLNMHLISGNSETYSVWDASTDTYVHNLRRRVPGYVTWDLGWRTQLTPQTSATLSVINLTDAAPPYRVHARSTTIPGLQADYGDYRGRSLSLQVQHQF